MLSFKSALGAKAVAGSRRVVCNARPLWAPGVVAPTYLKGELAGDFGFDPLGLAAESSERLTWYQQGELQNARWAMLGVAGILVQEVVHPDIWFYESNLPQNLPGPWKNVNMGGLLAFEFVMMHWVENLRFADIKNHGSVNEDPIHKGYKVANPELGYPGFDPLGMSKGNFAELKLKEIKNGRLAMIAFVGFIFQAQTTGKGPIASLLEHVGNPFGSNIGTNIHHCAIPTSVDVQGLTLPLSCLWPAFD